MGCHLLVEWKNIQVVHLLNIIVRGKVVKVPYRGPLESTILDYLGVEQHTLCRYEFSNVCKVFCCIGVESIEQYYFS